MEQMMTLVVLTGLAGGLFILYPALMWRLVVGMVKMVFGLFLDAVGLLLAWI